MCVSAELVRDAAGSGPRDWCATGGAASTCAGYRTKILDGNHLAASDHRWKNCVIRGRLLCLPDLVVLDQQPMLPPRSSCVKTGTRRNVRCWASAALGRTNDLWIADRNFCTWIFCLVLPREWLFCGAPARPVEGTVVGTRKLKERSTPGRSTNRDRSRQLPG